MRTYTIPNKFESYPEGQLPPELTAHLVFYPNPNELVHVHRWERYPDYDLIFGVPDKASPKYEKELSFFAVRRGSTGTYTHHYFDVLETEAVVQALQFALDESKKYSPHLWQS